MLGFMLQHAWHSDVRVLSKPLTAYNMPNHTSRLLLALSLGAVCGWPCHCSVHGDHQTRAYSYSLGLNACHFVKGLPQLASRQNAF